jgi:hypothetical protein
MAAISQSAAKNPDHDGCTDLARESATAMQTRRIRCPHAITSCNHSAIMIAGEPMQLRSCIVVPHAPELRAHEVEYRTILTPTWHLPAISSAGDLDDRGMLR